MTESSVSQPGWTSGRRAVLIVVVLCYGAVGLSVGAIPTAVEQAGGGATAVGVAMGSYAFTAIVARIVTGFVMVRVGYRSSLAGASVVLAVATALSAVPNATTIVFARLLLGLGVGAMMASATAWVVELPSEKNRTAQSIGSIGTVNYAVLALGAPIGLWITRTIDPHSALLIAAVLPTMAAALLVKVRAPSACGETIDVPPRRHDRRRRIYGASIVPGLALMLSGFGYAALVSFGAQLLGNRGLAGGGAVVAVYGLTMVATRVVLGPITDRISSVVWTAVAFASEGAGLVLMAVGRSEVVVFAGVAIVGSTMALIYPMLGAQVAAFAGELRGSALSVYGAFINLGIGGGSYVLGWVVSQTSLQTGFLVAAVTLLIGAVVAMSAGMRLGRGTSAQHSQF